MSSVERLSTGIVALPLSHSFGLLVTVGGLHRPTPATTVLLRWFDAATWLALAAQHRAQVAPVVPSMVAMLLGQQVEQYDLAALEYLYSGAAPLPAAIRDEFERRVPGTQIVEGYGCTETAGLISSTPHGRRRKGTVGQPVPNVRVRIVGLDGTDLPPGEDGEIVVSGPNVMAGYWNGERVAGGWFATGDIGHLDDEGYLSIVDRKKDLILRGGYNVYPRDVEDALVQHDDVVGAAVVGRPDDRLGEEVVAFVAVRPGATVTSADLVAFAKQRLAATKYPREVHVVDAIPLTSVGKVDRKRLRQEVRQSV
jgi:long-chain acyl-CoA synthetase